MRHQSPRFNDAMDRESPAQLHHSRRSRCLSLDLSALAGNGTLERFQIQSPVPTSDGGDVGQLSTRS